MTDWINFIAGMLVGFILGVGIMLGPIKESCEDMQTRIEGYRLCMELGSQCRMEVEHFIDYYQLKEELEQCPRKRDVSGG
jgi:hypothetical protein